MQAKLRKAAVVRFAGAAAAVKRSRKRLEGQFGKPVGRPHSRGEPETVMPEHIGKAGGTGRMSKTGPGTASFMHPIQDRADKGTIKFEAADATEAPSTLAVLEAGHRLKRRRLAGGSALEADTVASSPWRMDGPSAGSIERESITTAGDATGAASGSVSGTVSGTVSLPFTRGDIRTHASMPPSSFTHRSLGEDNDKAANEHGGGSWVRLAA